MSARLHAFVARAVLLVGLVPGAGCSDDPPPVTRRPTSAPAATPSAAAGSPGTDPALANADIPEKLKSMDWNAKDDLDRDLRDTRDPFQLYVDDLRPKAEVPGATRPEDSACQGALCEEEAAGLNLIAIITGTAVHKAMLVDHRGTGYMVRAGDVVGKLPFRITRITRNEVVMKPLQPPVAGQPPPQEVVKRLVSQEELQELLP